MDSQLEQMGFDCPFSENDIIRLDKSSLNEFQSENSPRFIGNSVASFGFKCKVSQSQ